jgi:hypothetical protein
VAVTPALVPAAFELLGHRLIGASTGYMTDRYGDWPALVSRACEVSTAAVELSALAEPELGGLGEYLDEVDWLPFEYVAVHGPSKERSLPEAELAFALASLGPEVATIVLHPDELHAPAAFGELGPTLALENMDARKRTGRTADELTEAFAALPAAGLCLDVAHAASVDPTMAVAHELLDVHGHRLRHVHISSLDEHGHHLPLSAADQRRFAAVLDRCRDVPWILEAPVR